MNATKKPITYPSVKNKIKKNKNETIVKTTQTIETKPAKIIPDDQSKDQKEKKTPLSISFDDVADFEWDQPKFHKSEPCQSNCTTCNGLLTAQYDILVCNACGEEYGKSTTVTEDDYSTSAITDCNVNSNGFIAFKMKGKGSYGCQKSLLISSANYGKYSKMTAIKDIINLDIHSEKHHIPKNVIRHAIEMFDTIKNHGYVFRNGGKKGVQSACLYYACYAFGIIKTPSEIAQFYGIDEEFHSAGDRILHDLNEKGIISIPTKIKPISQYVDRYMELLGIPTQYKNFIIDLIDRAEKKSLHIRHDSKNNTKSVGAIYMLITRIAKLRNSISQEKIEQECGISKATFLRYYEMLDNNYKKLKKVFKRHSIPMPVKWRD